MWDGIVGDYVLDCNFFVGVMLDFESESSFSGSFDVVVEVLGFLKWIFGGVDFVFEEWRYKFVKFNEKFGDLWVVLLDVVIRVSM